MVEDMVKDSIKSHGHVILFVNQKHVPQNSSSFKSVFHTFLLQMLVVNTRSFHRDYWFSVEDSKEGTASHYMN